MIRKEAIAKEISQLLPNLIRHMYPFVFEPIELPPSQVIALCILSEKGSCRLGQLSREMHNSPPTASGIVDRLENGGYVKRHEDENDRRATDIILTEKGKRIVDQFRSNIRQRWQFILTKLSEGEGEEVLKVLLRITKAFTHDAK